jgi:Mrp family chromosome partitioning ATPase
MSRVYTALTGALRPSGAAVLDTPDDGAWENSDEPAVEVAADDGAPFIEIGGPSGPVFSPSLTPPPALHAVAEAKIEGNAGPITEPARTFPRLAPTPATAYLSVRFHDVQIRGKGRHDGPDASLVAFHLPDHPVSGEYRTLRDEICKQLPDLTSHLVMFTAASSEAGTTTVLLNLAITLAGEAKTRVLVVDGDVKRPAIARKLGVKPGPGVCEVLANRVPLTLAVQPSAVQRLDALAAGDAIDATPVAIGREFPRLLGQLRQWYDWVLLDGGTWGALPERDGTCPTADAVYLVTRDTHAERPEFAALRGCVKELGGLLRGYVTTRV